MMARGVGLATWPVHCGVALGASAGLLLLAATFVRKVALRQATGQSVLLSAKKKLETSGDATMGRSIRRVVGSPVFWKERRTPLLGKLGALRIVVGILAMGLLLLTYALCAREDMLGDDEAQVTYIVIFAGLGILFTMVLPATSITSEKESRAWPILLTTTVSNWEVLWGKFLGALRRCSAAWLLLFAHVVVFTLPGIIHPVALLQLGILVAWIIFFLCATGLYFSTRFKRTTTAVVANVALAVAIWGVFPLLLGLTLEVTRTGDDLLEFYLDMNPVVHAIVIAMATANGGSLDTYDWIQGGTRDLGSAMGWILFNFVVHVGVGLAFLWRAWSRLRRNPV
jgi:ABC-type transport system involved in multi-copper enzyme maturation permease subunit